MSEKRTLRCEKCLDFHCAWPITESHRTEDCACSHSTEPERRDGDRGSLPRLRSRSPQPIRRNDAFQPQSRGAIWDKIDKLGDEVMRLKYMPSTRIEALEKSLAALELGQKRTDSFNRLIAARMDKIEKAVTGAVPEEKVEVKEENGFWTRYLMGA